MNDERLQRFLDRLVDREAVDWDAAERELPQRALRALRRIDSIAAAYRRVAPTADAQRFGRLVLIERIGGGFGGEVWRARDPLLERVVALKLDDGSADAARQARLLEEARTLARVDHPNVLRVLGADVVAGRVGIWSEFVDGEDLAARLRREGRSGTGETQAIGSALCGALAAVHAAGFVHGDVKPHNVLRTNDGRYVLCDLGSAVALRDRVATRALASGSPLYLAPEVLAGGAPSVASDVYALGATLFHLLGGRTPVDGDDVDALLAAHRAGRRARLRDLRPDLPPQLVAAIERALDAEPARRHASVGAFEAALTPRVPTRTSVPAAAATLAAALVLVAVLTWRTPAPSVLASNVRWVRGDGATLLDGATVRQGDTLYVNLRCARACWTYVYAENGAHAVSALFPLAATAGNPQAADTAFDLPGRIDGRLRHWRVGAAEGDDERLLLIVAEAPLAAFEAPAETVALVDGEHYRGIDAVVAAPEPGLTGGLDALSERARGSSGGYAETHWLRLRRADAGEAPLAPAHRQRPGNSLPE